MVRILFTRDGDAEKRRGQEDREEGREKEKQKYVDLRDFNI